MAVYQDGTFPSGAGVLAINNVNYVCNSFTYTKPSNVVQITDQNGEPSGALAFGGFMTGTAEVQFSAANVAEPTTAAANATTGVFTATIENTSTICFITSVDISKPSSSNWLATIAWQKKIN
jgi:hypothetical protein